MGIVSRHLPSCAADRRDDRKRRPGRRIGTLAMAVALAMAHAGTLWAQSYGSDRAGYGRGMPAGDYDRASAGNSGASARSPGDGMPSRITRGGAVSSSSSFDAGEDAMSDPSDRFGEAIASRGARAAKGRKKARRERRRDGRCRPRTAFDRFTARSDARVAYCANAKDSANGIP